MRVAQPEGQRGSLKWIQLAVERSPHVLQPAGLPPITWVSPRLDDARAEYRDAAFLEVLGLGGHAPALAEFWPQRGPQWDALGQTERGPVLVEAKAHVQEFFSPASQAGALSMTRIRHALDSVRADLGVTSGADWSQLFFQYANRLAFLWWLRSRGIDAKLLFVSFLHDTDMHGPQHAETWEVAFACAEYALGLPKGHKLRAHILHVTPDVRQLSAKGA